MYRIMEHSSRAIVRNSDSTHEVTTSAKASSSIIKYVKVEIILKEREVAFLSPSNMPSTF